MSKSRPWYPRCPPSGNKISYPDEAAALQARDRFYERGGVDPGLHVYDCEHCYGCHLGSSYRSLARTYDAAT